MQQLGYFARDYPFVQLSAGSENLTVDEYDGKSQGFVPNRLEEIWQIQAPGAEELDVLD